ncbi:MAG: ABC transporter substrate-binding protein, partial [Chloroflexota bacterium]
GNLLKPCREDVEKVCSAVAEAWEANADFTQYAFKIRDGILWHDGTPFTAEHAKFWLDLAFFGARAGDKVRAPAYFKGQMGEIKDVEALSGNRLRVTLAKPDPFWAATMTHLESANRAAPT